MESSGCLMILDIYLDSDCVTDTFIQLFSINILSGTNEAHIISLPCETSKCFRIFLYQNFFLHKYKLQYVTLFPNKTRTGICKEI